MRKRHIITLPALDRALDKVTAELDRHGFWDARLARVDVELGWLGDAYGWQRYGHGGQIVIPAVSMLKVADCVFGSYTSLIGVLRHEYGHAVADTHRGLLRSRRFVDAFGAPHESEDGFEYDPRFFVSGYAATNPAEDFAEVFMTYLRTRGRLPRVHATEPIRRKWRFVRELGGRIRAGARRW